MGIGNALVELRPGWPHAAVVRFRVCVFSMVIGLAVFHPAKLSACTLMPGYVGPSNLDLALEAESIVLAKVERQRRYSDGDSMPRVILRPVEALKGALPRELISLEGYVGSTEHVRASYSDPNELVEAHPQSFDGFCVRYVFMPGSTLLLFLKRDAEGWQAIMPPFSRTAEDVPSRRSRWVKAVRLYARVSQLPKEQQVDALLQEQAALRRRDSRDSRAIADDIDRVLAQRPASSMAPSE